MIDRRGGPIFEVPALVWMYVGAVFICYGIASNVNVAVPQTPVPTERRTYEGHVVGDSILPSGNNARYTYTLKTDAGPRTFHFFGPGKEVQTLDSMIREDMYLRVELDVPKGTDPWQNDITRENINIIK